MRKIMAKELTKQQQSQGIWDDKIDIIKNAFAADLTRDEFTMFVELGRSLNLNPFKREIWCVKYGNAAPSIFVGRDGYRKTAQEQPDYDGHMKEAIYENDEYQVKDGSIHHTINFKNRGKLIGAYCEVYRKGMGHPFRETVMFREYYRGNRNSDGSIKKRKYRDQWVDMKPTNWDTMPETMIKKVAEAQALRMAYQGLFAGTYDESEQWRPTPEDGGDAIVISTVSQKKAKDKLKAAPDKNPPHRDTKTLKEAPTYQKPSDVLTMATPEPEAPNKGGRKLSKVDLNFIQYMQKIKADIREITGNDKAYYQTLGTAGYEHCNEIHDHKTRHEVYRSLKTSLNELQEELKSA